MRMSQKELGKHNRAIEILIKDYLYSEMRDLMENIVYRLLIISDAIKLRASSGMTRGELVRWFERYHQISQEPYNRQKHTGLLVGYIEYDESAIVEFIETRVLATLNAGENNFLRDNPEMENLPNSNKKRPSKRDLERKSKALNLKADYLISAFCEDVSSTLLSIEVLEEIIEAHISEELSLSDLKLWLKKWEDADFNEITSFRGLLNEVHIGNIAEAKTKMFYKIFNQFSKQIKILHLEIRNAI